MFISHATKALSRHVVWKTDSFLSLGVMRCLQNNAQSQELFIVQKRFKKTSSEEKERCEEEPKKSSKFVKLATIAVIGTTVSVIAAKYDDDFREWTKEHVPAIDKLVKVIFQEEETYLQSLDRAHKEISVWIKNTLYYMFKETDTHSKGRKTIQDSFDLDDIEDKEEIKKPYQPPEPILAVKPDEKGNGKEPQEIKDLRKLEERFGKAAQETMQTIAKTNYAIKGQGRLISHLDQIINSNNRRIWEKLEKLRKDAVKGEEKALTSFEGVKYLENQIKSKLKDDVVLGDDIKAKLRNNVNTVMKDIKDGLDKIAKDKENSVLSKQSWDKVKAARMHFSEELETFFPNVWLNDENLNINVDELDPFLQNVLDDLELKEIDRHKFKSIYESNVDYNLGKYKNNRAEALDDIVKATAAIEVNKEGKKMQALMKKNLLAFQAKCQKMTKSQAKQTTEVYKELTAEAVKMKEKEVERKVNQQYEERLAQLRAQHKLEIAKMVGRIQGANQAIGQRGSVDKEQQVKQQFWSAAQSLMAAVQPIGAEAKSSSRKPLKNEVDNINKAKPEGDTLVDSVISSIPQEALDRGVPSEACLRERFKKVMKCAQGWAGVPPGEITLLQLLMARIQSVLYLNITIPQAELDNEPAIDPDKLNNYNILHRAKYYVDRGEFDQALRYLNLLKGPSSMAVSDWVQETLRYLETKQAAELLMGYATAANMQA